MAKFNADAYNKLFPRKAEKPIIESAVQTFTPTADLEEGKEPETEVIVPVVEETDSTEGGENLGNSSSDNGSDN